MFGEMYLRDNLQDTRSTERVIKMRKILQNILELNQLDAVDLTPQESKRQKHTTQ